MRVIYLLLFLQLVCKVSGAKDNPSTMVVNTINDEATKLTATLYKYKNYIDGKIIYDDNGTAEAKMNYNQLSGKMLFISPKGDTLEFAKPEIFSMIIAGVDTFYYF